MFIRTNKLNKPHKHIFKSRPLGSMKLYGLLVVIPLFLGIVVVAIMTNIINRQVDSYGQLTAKHFESQMTIAMNAAETVEVSENEGVEGTYVFGIVNAFGSTVPYVLCLKEDGDAAIVMDNSFTGARIYTGTWEGEE